MSNILRNIAISLVLCSVATVGCASTQPVKPIDVTAIVQEPVEVPEIDPAIANAGIQRSSLSSFTTLVEWPSRPEADACGTSVIETNDDDGVLIEGRAYVKRSLDEIYADLVTPEIVGPRHMTNDFTMDAFEETPLKTSYVLHVTVKYILTIQFDLAWTIEPIFENGKRVGYHTATQKTEGSSHLKEITNRMDIIEVEPGLVSVELSSYNRATMNKVEESKGYAVGLFDYWSNVCHAKSENVQAEENVAGATEAPVDVPAEAVATEPAE